MAVNVGTTSGNTNTTNNNNNGNNNSTNNNSNSAPAQRTTNLFNFKSLVSARAGSDAVNNWHKKLVETYAIVPEAAEMEVAVLKFDNMEDRNLHYSYVVVAVRDLSGTGGNVAAHTLILESTGDDPMPTKTGYGGRQMVWQQSAPDAFNDILTDKIQHTLKSHYGEQTNVWLTDATVIPRKFDIEDADAYQKIASNAFDANFYQLLTHRPGFSDINLRDSTDWSSTVVELRTQGDNFVDITNRPNRADGIIDFAVVQNNGRGTNPEYAVLNTGQHKTPVSQLTMFPDLTVNKARKSGFGQVMNQNPDYRTFVPNLVISSLEQFQGHTPATTALSLFIGTVMAQDQNWYQFYKPTSVGGGGKKTNLKDIGILNLIAGVPDPDNGNKVDRVKTTDASFTLENLGQYLQTIFYPTPTISVDIPRHGANTWVTSVYDIASSDNPKTSKDRESAYKFIYNTFNHLFCGEFRNHFRFGDELFVNRDNLIHAGTRVVNGVERDLRELDFTAVANVHLDKSPDLVKRYSDTFNPAFGPIEERLSVRFDILKGIDASITHTGYFNRITLSGKLVDAMMKSAIACSLRLNVVTQVQSGEFNNSYMTANWLDAAMINGDGNNGVFATGGFGGNMGNGNGGGFGGRAYHNSRIY